jgi:hypothetical protein
MSEMFRFDELLKRAAQLAESDRNLEIMDRATILHGYLELTKLDPNNRNHQRSVQDAAASLLELISGRGEYEPSIELPQTSTTMVPDTRLDGAKSHMRIIDSFANGRAA